MWISFQRHLSSKRKGKSVYFVLPPRWNCAQLPALKAQPKLGTGLMPTAQLYVASVVISTFGLWRFNCALSLEFQQIGMLHFCSKIFVIPLYWEVNSMNTVKPKPCWVEMVSVLENNLLLIIFRPRTLQDILTVSFCVDLQLLPFVIEFIDAA